MIAAAFALVTFAKGRLFLGAIAIFIPLVGIWCTFRLAKRTSLWARRRYREATERGRTKLSRARKRFPPDRWSERFGRRFQDLIGGTPTAELGGGTAAHHDIDRTAG